jgi:hypothetical protein
MRWMLNLQAVEIPNCIYFKDIALLYTVKNPMATHPALRYLKFVCLISELRSRYFAQGIE